MANHGQPSTLLPSLAADSEPVSHAPTHTRMPPGLELATSRLIAAPLHTCLAPLPRTPARVHHEVTYWSTLPRHPAFVQREVTYWSPLLTGKRRYLTYRHFLHFRHSYYVWLCVAMCGYVWLCVAM